MEVETKIEMQKENIREAIEDYGRHISDGVYILENISEKFISNLARDNVEAKSELRDLFRKSPCWDEQLDALVINGTRTHNPDYNRVDHLATILLKNYLNGADFINYRRCMAAMDFFKNGASGYPLEVSIDAIKELAPNAYKPKRKKSRVFRQLCIALGVWDDTAGSEFQATFAEFADELSAKKIDYKLFVSLNPAHFLTMSNPKYDKRGCTLTSCHSLNSAEYHYNNGCSGYARDPWSFIVFTVSNPNEPELLNNRKTTRQIFAYKPGNGVLLQSRLYNSFGGTRGAQEESKEYRDLIQREISTLEGAVNLWKTQPYYESILSPEGDVIDILASPDFGGYPDWDYQEFSAMISVRQDHRSDAKGFFMGENGLCVVCGGETEEGDGLHCSSCQFRHLARCECCEEDFDEDELFWVFDADRNNVRVCESCRDRDYTMCYECEEYYPDEIMVNTASGDVCPECLERHFSYCPECNQYHRNTEMNRVINEMGERAGACDDCIEDHFRVCDDCNRIVHNNRILECNDEWICEECAAANESEEDMEEGA